VAVVLRVVVAVVLLVAHPVARGSSQRYARIGQRNQNFIRLLRGENRHSRELFSRRKWRTTARETRTVFGVLRQSSIIYAEWIV
jgi:hypothetical protein